MWLHLAFQSMLWRHKCQFFPTKSLSNIVHLLLPCLKHTWLWTPLVANRPLWQNPPSWCSHLCVISLSAHRTYELFLTNRIDKGNRQSLQWLLCVIEDSICGVLSFFLPTCWVWRSKLPPVLQPQRAECCQQAHEQGISCSSSWDFGWECSPSHHFKGSSQRPYVGGPS